MGIKEYLNGKDDGITRRNMLKALGAGAATATTAGCITDGKTTEPTATTTETETPNTTEEPTTTEQNTTTEQKPEYPIEIDPKTEEVNLQRVYENSIETPTDFNNRMQKATHDEIDAEGLDNIAAEFDTREEKLKNVAAAAAAQYRSRTLANQAIVKAAHDTFDWFNYENGARADIESMIEGKDIGPATVLTYEDENGQLQNKLMFGLGMHTLPNEWKGSYQNSQYMQADNDSQVAAMDFEILDKVKHQIRESFWPKINSAQDNFLYGARFDDANMVFTMDGGLHTSEKLKTSPEAAREIKDEVNAAYTWAENNHGLEDDYLEIDASGESLSYRIIEEERAEEVMKWS